MLLPVLDLDDDDDAIVQTKDQEAEAAQRDGADSPAAVDNAVHIHYKQFDMAAPPGKLLIPPISPASPGPLYQQIVDGVKREISEGRLAPGSALPSFRGLAEQLLVSVITVARAYEDLEREGIIFRRQGLGTFVSDLAEDRSREAKTARARDLIEQAVREATEAGLAPQDIVDLLRRAIANRNRGRS